MFLDKGSALSEHKSVVRYFLFESHRIVATFIVLGASKAFKIAPKTLAPEEIPTDNPNLLICLAILIASESFTRKTGLSAFKSTIFGIKLSPIPSIRCSPSLFLLGRIKHLV